MPRKTRGALCPAFHSGVKRKGGSPAGGLASIAHAWEMREPSGDRSDLEGGVTLVDVNTVQAAAGPLGTVAYCDAANGEELVTASGLTTQLHESSMTVAGWLRIDSGSSIEMLWGSDINAGQRVIPNLQMTSGPNVRGFIRDSASATNATAPVSVPHGTWAHVAVVWDLSAEQMTLYVDGVAGSPVGLSNPPDDSQAPQLYKIRAGGSNVVRHNQVQIYHDALSAADIAALAAGLTYEQIKGTVPAARANLFPLVAYRDHTGWNTPNPAGVTISGATGADGAPNTGVRGDDNGTVNNVSVRYRVPLQDLGINVGDYIIAGCYLRPTVGGTSRHYVNHGGNLNFIQSENGRIWLTGGNYDPATQIVYAADTGEFPGWFLGLKAAQVTNNTSTRELVAFLPAHSQDPDESLYLDAPRPAVDAVSDFQFLIGPFASNEEALTYAANATHTNGMLPHPAGYTPP